VSVHFVAFGFKQSAANRRKMGRDAMLSMKDPLDEIVDDITEIEETVFNSGGRRAGGSWKRVTPRWQRRKAAKGLDARTMHATKRLRRSLTYRGDPEMIQDVRPLEGTIRFGTKVPYAEMHAKGLHGMPKRPVITFTQGDKKRWAKKIAKFVKKEYSGRARTKRNP